MKDKPTPSKNHIAYGHIHLGRRELLRAFLWGGITLHFKIDYEKQQLNLSHSRKNLL